MIFSVTLPVMYNTFLSLCTLCVLLCLSREDFSTSYHSYFVNLYAPALKLKLKRYKHSAPKVSLLRRFYCIVHVLQEVVTRIDAVLGAATGVTI